MAGRLGAEEMDALDNMIDHVGVAELIVGIGEICEFRSQHFQDSAASKAWMKDAERIIKFATAGKLNDLLG